MHCCNFFHALAVCCNSGHFIVMNNSQNCVYSISRKILCIALCVHISIFIDYLSVDRKYRHIVFAVLCWYICNSIAKFRYIYIRIDSLTALISTPPIHHSDEYFMEKKVSSVAGQNADKRGICLFSQKFNKNPLHAEKAFSQQFQQQFQLQTTSTVARSWRQQQQQQQYRIWPKVVGGSSSSSAAAAQWQRQQQQRQQDVGLVNVSEHIDAKVLCCAHRHLEPYIGTNINIWMVVFSQIRHIVYRWVKYSKI